MKVANCALGLTIAIVYRAPDTSAGDFATELSDLIHSGRLGTRHVICGDLNCPGPAGTKGLVAVELARYEEMVRDTDIPDDNVRDRHSVFRCEDVVQGISRSKSASLRFSTS